MRCPESFSEQVAVEERLKGMAYVKLNKEHSKQRTANTKSLATAQAEFIWEIVKRVKQVNRKVVGDESKIAVGQVLQNPVGKIRGSDYMLMVK